MSHSTESVHVRGVRRSRMIDAIEQRMRDLGLHRLVGSAGAHDDVRRLVLRRDGRWFSLVDAEGFDRGYGQPDVPGADVQDWARDLSMILERSVLSLSTWDGESSVTAARWKNGACRAELSLLDEAYRGKDGRAYAPAKPFWPWLSRETRARVLASGIKLVSPTGGSTGDAEVDEMLEDFDDDERPEPAHGGNGGADDVDVYVPLTTSVSALAAAVGMRRPLLSPHEPEKRDVELLFHPA